MILLARKFQTAPNSSEDKLDVNISSRKIYQANNFLEKIQYKYIILTIVGSWLLVHTVFALEYAYRYYHDTNITSKQSPCLDFPNETDPDYWEFLYFSFVIGMTSQVSDVQTTSRLMRRLALLHGIISFFFNTSILAMSINIIAALI